MALRTPPSWLQNGSHPAENDRLTTQAIWKTSGLVNSTDLQITQNGGGNMSVNVSSGWAAIVGTTQTNMGTYMAYNDASTNLTISTASGSNPRIDLVVITINDAYYTGTLNNVSFQVIAGTPAASPTVPATPANSLALGQIAVGTSVTSILTANITNYGTLATSPFGNVSTTGTQTLTNKSLSDTTTNIVGASDATKKLNISVAGQTTGVTGILATSFTTAKTLTLPDATDTVVARNTTDTLTNKSLSDTTTNIINASDATKKLNISVAGQTTGITGIVASSFTTAKTLTLPDATDTLVGKATTDILTNKTLTTPAINGGIFAYPLEAWYINATNFSGYTAYLQTNNAVHYLTTASTANGTLNITYASGTTLNTAMVTGQAITFSLLITNTTAYYVNAVQVDGGAVTPKWSGGTAPTAGNASAVDIYSFTVLKTGSAAFTVLAAGPIKYA